jgi:hypothetical protein
MTDSEFLAALKAPVGKVQFLTVPEMVFLMVDGTGDPNTALAYREAVEALYSIAYTAKFDLKKSSAEQDFKVSPLEGLWWSPDPDDFYLGRKDNWLWTSLMRVPDHFSEELLARTITAVRKKKSLPGLDRVRLETFLEGLSAQTMHIGPYSAEAPTIAMLHQEIAAKGYALSGKHHEIYLGDPRRGDPAKLKTVIRQPVALL